jgi:hypothetical protein
MDEKIEILKNEIKQDLELIKDNNEFFKSDFSIEDCNDIKILENKKLEFKNWLTYFNNINYNSVMKYLLDSDNPILINEYKYIKIQMCI